MTRRRIVALTGLSGAGKSTLVRIVGKRVAFTPLSASTLLKERAARGGDLPNSETLRLGDFDENQQMLIQAFNEQAVAILGDIILDCHTIIDTSTGLQVVPSSVFMAMGITAVAFLSVDPEELAKRRAQDVDRLRPFRTVEELAAHQNVAITAARQIAQAIGATFADIGPAPEIGIHSLLHTGKIGGGQ